MLRCQFLRGKEPHGEKGDLLRYAVRRAVIPAAGLGMRFLPMTKAQPKEMGRIEGEEASQDGQKGPDQIFQISWPLGRKHSPFQLCTTRQAAPIS